MGPDTSPLGRPLPVANRVAPWQGNEWPQSQAVLLATSSQLLGVQGQGAAVWVQAPQTFIGEPPALGILQVNSSLLYR